MKYKFFNTEVKSTDKEDRTITAIGSTSDVDRDKDIVDIKGMNLKNFKNNGVFLWSHNSSLPPIGKALSVSKSKDGLKFKLEFAGPDVNPQADTIFKLFKGGFLSAFSIGFQPDWESASYNDKRGGFDFPKSELLEISAVNVPANQNALIQRSIKEGCIDELEANDLNEFIKKNKQKLSQHYTKSEVDCIIKSFNEKVEELNKRFDVHPVIDKEELEDTGELHIIDQILEEYFDSSDDKSIDDPEVDSKDDDLNSILTELE